jgi:acetyl esterase
VSTPARLHPQIQSLLDAELLHPLKGGPPDLEASRAGYLQTALERGGALEPVAATADVVIATSGGARIRARVYTPLNGARVAGTFIWLHGGGWCIGDLEGFDRVGRSLANASGAEVASVAYRLAPENPFPAAVDDADAAVAWALDRGGPVAIGGDSAGGNLATVAARHARDAGLDVRAQLLVYPVTDGSMRGESYREHDMPLLTAGEMRLCWTAYAAGGPLDDPDISPLDADLAGLAPAYVAVAGFDVLRDDGLRYAAALEAAGVPVELDVYEDMSHGFLRWGGVVERARELVDALGAFAGRRLAG